MGELNILFLKNNFQFSILGSDRILTPPMFEILHQI